MNNWYSFNDPKLIEEYKTSHIFYPKRFPRLFWITRPKGYGWDTIYPIFDFTLQDDKIIAIEVWHDGTAVEYDLSKEPFKDTDKMTHRFSWILEPEH